MKPVFSRLFKLQFDKFPRTPFKVPDIFNDYPLCDLLRMKSGKNSRIKILVDFLRRNYLIENYEPDIIIFCLYVQLFGQIPDAGETLKDKAEGRALQKIDEGMDSGSDKVKPESYGVLKDIASVLKENKDIQIKIVGHTDSKGDEAFNMMLSKKRSLAIKKAL